MLSQKIREERERLGLSQVAVARSSGVARSQLAAFEGGANVSVTTLEKILREISTLRLDVVPADLDLHEARRAAADVERYAALMQDAARACSPPSAEANRHFRRWAVAKEPRSTPAMRTTSPPRNAPSCSGRSTRFSGGRATGVSFTGAVVPRDARAAPHIRLRAHKRIARGAATTPHAGGQSLLLEKPPPARASVGRRLHRSDLSKVRTACAGKRVTDGDVRAFLIQRLTDLHVGNASATLGAGGEYSKKRKAYR